MLYKKYHRNFIRQFKKGVKFNILSEEKVQKEPWYDNDNKVIYVKGNKYGCWILVYSDGIIDKCRPYVV